MYQDSGNAVFWIRKYTILDTEMPAYILALLWQIYHFFFQNKNYFFFRKCCFLDSEINDSGYWNASQHPCYVMIDSYLLFSKQELFFFLGFPDTIPDTEMPTSLLRYDIFFPFSKQELFFLLWLFLCLFRFVLAVGVAATVVTFSRLTAAGDTTTTAASAFIPPGIHVDMFGGGHGSGPLRFVCGALFFLLLVLVLHGVFLVIMSVFVGPRTCCRYPGHCCSYCCCDCCCCWRWKWWWWYWVLVLPFSAAGGEDNTLSQYFLLLLLLLLIVVIMRITMRIMMISNLGAPFQCCCMSG